MDAWCLDGILRCDTMTLTPSGSSGSSHGGQDSPGPVVCVHLLSLILALFKCTDESLKALLRQVLCWLAWLTDHSAWLNASPVDALQGPVPRGTKRARTLDPQLKAAVAQASSTA
eukprot:1788920-Lingulodinium_polyedra.AAC.1